MKPDNILPISKSLKLVGNPIAYYPSIAKALGSVKVAIFLCQFLYWEGKQDDPEGWIYKTMEEIFEETGLSFEEQRGARKILKDLKILKEEKRGIPARNYYKFDWNILDELLNNYYAKKEKPQEIENLDDKTSENPTTRCGKTPPLLHRIHTENTTVLNNNNNKENYLLNVNNLQSEINLSLREIIDNDMRVIIGRPPTSWFETSELEKLYETYGFDKTREALRKCKIQNKFSLAYLKGVLQENGNKKVIAGHRWSEETMNKKFHVIGEDE